MHRLADLTKNYTDVYYIVFEYVGQLNNYTASNCTKSFGSEFCKRKINIFGIIIEICFLQLGIYL